MCSTVTLTGSLGGSKLKFKNQPKVTNSSFTLPKMAKMLIATLMVLICIFYFTISSSFYAFSTIYYLKNVLCRTKTGCSVKEIVCSITKAVYASQKPYLT